MSASGGTGIESAPICDQDTVDDSRTSEDIVPEMSGNSAMLSNERNEPSAVHGHSLQEAVSHPLQQLSVDDDSPDSPDCAQVPQLKNVSNHNIKVGRRVTFGEGEKIVSGYMDPPSPWNDVKLCSTEELVAAYLDSCDKHHIKPIPGLLKQLHAITNFCDRNETLSLRGERLDIRHCETLEEILRRVQFRCIDLEATHLEEEGAIALFDMVEYYESSERLNISYNRTIGPRGWHSCSRMIKKTPCLEHLEARHCTISEQVTPILGRSLRAGTSLRTLHLESSIQSGRPLMILVAAIKSNDTLRELFLADNKLMPTDGIQLGNLIKINHRLQVLDVRNNHLQDNGVGHISEGLFEQDQGEGLTTLVLWNNQVTFQSMHNLSRALYATRSIETLNLGHNNITNEGIHRLKDGLLHNKSLQRIGLQAAKVSCEGAVALAEYIAESKSLLRLDLRENEIKTGGLMALSLALKMCMSINRIDLDKEPKKESGVRDYADQQSRLLADISKYMMRNREHGRKLEEQKKREEEERERQQQELMDAAATVTEAATAEDKSPQELGQGESVNEEKIEPDNNADHSPQQSMRLHLNLPITSRSQELESPAFVREFDLPVIIPPQTVVEEDAEDSKAEEDVEGLFSGRVLPGEFPPSPMVSNNGSPLLAHIVEPPPQMLASPIQASPTVAAPPPPPAIKNQSLHVPANKHKKRSNSPNSHKFVISRVKESPREKPKATKEVQSKSPGVEPPTASSQPVKDDSSVKKESTVEGSQGKKDSMEEGSQMKDSMDSSDDGSQGKDSVDSSEEGSQGKDSMDEGSQESYSVEEEEKEAQKKDSTDSMDNIMGKEAQGKEKEDSMEEPQGKDSIEENVQGNSDISESKQTESTEEPPTKSPVESSKESPVESQAESPAESPVDQGTTAENTTASMEPESDKHKEEQIQSVTETDMLTDKVEGVAIGEENKDISSPETPVVEDELQEKTDNLDSMEDIDTEDDAIEEKTPSKEAMENTDLTQTQTETVEEESTDLFEEAKNPSTDELFGEDIDEATGKSFDDELEDNDDEERGDKVREIVSPNGISLELVQAMQEPASGDKEDISATDLKEDVAADTDNTDDPTLTKGDNFEQELNDMLAGIVKTNP